MWSDSKSKTTNLIEKGYMNKNIDFKIDGYYQIENLNFDTCICLHFSTFIFIFGIIGIILNNKNLIFIIIYVDLMFFGLILHLIFLSFLINNPVGFIYGLFVINLAVVETVIGLSIFVLKFRKGNILTSQALISTR